MNMYAIKQNRANLTIAHCTTVLQNLGYNAQKGKSVSFNK